MSYENEQKQPNGSILRLNKTLSVVDRLVQAISKSNRNISSTIGSQAFH